MNFLYLPKARGITRAFPLTSVKEVVHEGPTRFAPDRDESWEIHLQHRSSVTTAAAPYIRETLHPHGWESWVAEVTTDYDAEGRPDIAVWTNSPVVAVTMCTPIPSGDPWFELPTAHGLEDTRPVLIVDTQRSVCWSNETEGWHNDLAAECGRLLEMLEAKHPRLKRAMPPWLAPAETPSKPLRKGKAA